MLRVPAAGAILGRCVPELASLCWEDTDNVAMAHCKVACVDGVFCVCDLGAAGEGTMLDGRRLGSHWAPLRDGCDIDLGLVRIRVELAPVHFALGRSLPPVIAGVEAAPHPKNVEAKRGGWRSAKKARIGHVPAPTENLCALERRLEGVADAPDDRGRLAGQGGGSVPVSVAKRKSAASPSTDEAPSRGRLAFWAARDPSLPPERWIP